MKTLAEIRAEREEAALVTKIASVQTALGDDPVVIETLDRAIDLVKEAGVTNPEEILDIATQMTIDHLKLGQEAVEKVAADELAAAEEAGVEAARTAFEAGVTTEDLAKLAEDESAAFGEALAFAVAIRAQTGEK